MPVTERRYACQACGRRVKADERGLLAVHDVRLDVFPWQARCPGSGQVPGQRPLPL